VAILSLLVLLSTLSALGGSLWYSGQLEETLQTVRQQERDLELRNVDLEDRTNALRRRVYADEMRRAAEAYREGRAPEVRQRLENWKPKPGEADLRSFVWWMMWNRLERTSRVIATFADGAVAASIAVSPSGDVVATGEPDGIIRVRSLADGRLLYELRGHQPGGINAVKFYLGSEGEQLISASDDQTVRVWDVASRQERLLLGGHQGAVMAVEVLGQDAEAIATAADDGHILVWDSRTGQLRSKLSGHREAVRALVEQKSPGTLFSCSQDETILAWDWRNGGLDSRLQEGMFAAPEEFSFARTLAFGAERQNAAGRLSDRMALFLGCAILGFLRRSATRSRASGRHSQADLAGREGPRGRLQ
jgi:hypothetical protein